MITVNRHIRFFLVLLGLVALACSPLPTAVPTSPPPPTAASATATPPLPTTRPTTVPNIRPTLPSCPGRFNEYPQVLANYLGLGGSPEALAEFLGACAALGFAEAPVQVADLTGEGDPEIVVVIVDPGRASTFIPTPGDLLILRRQDGTAEPVFSAVQQGGSPDLGYFLLSIEDINGNGRPEVPYYSRSCGAHTCFDRLFVLEWDGADYVNLIPGFLGSPYATFSFDQGQIAVDIGGIASVGAGVQRDYSEIWSWDGAVYTLTEQIVGPPLVGIHYLYDGDDALLQGDVATAIEDYQQALRPLKMEPGLFAEGAEEILRAFARFKLMIAFSLAGEPAFAEDVYQQMLSEHPPGSPGFIYLQMASAFRQAYQESGDAREACAAANAVAAAHPEAVDALYAGYANTLYLEPGDLCRVP